MYGLDPDEEYFESLQNEERKRFAIAQAQQGDLTGAKQMAEMINLGETRDETLVAIVGVEARTGQIKAAKETVETITFEWHRISALCAIACREVLHNPTAAAQTIETAKQLLAAIKHECYHVVAVKNIFLAHKEMALAMALEQSRTVAHGQRQSLDRILFQLTQTDEWRDSSPRLETAPAICWELVRR